MIILVKGLINALILFGVGANPPVFLGSEFRRSEGTVQEQ
jgi:hypothetical protein